MWLSRIRIFPWSLRNKSDFIFYFVFIFASPSFRLFFDNIFFPSFVLLINTSVIFNIEYKLSRLQYGLLFDRDTGKRMQKNKHVPTDTFCCGQTSMAGCQRHQVILKLTKRNSIIRQYSIPEEKSRICMMLLL